MLFLCDRLGPHERRFVAGMSRRGMEVFALELGGAGPAGAVHSVQNAVRQLRPQLVQAGPVTGAGYWAAQAGARPLLLMSYSWDLLLPPDNGTVARRRAALAAADGALCDCRAVADAIAALEPRLHGHTSIFPWGVELERFRPGAMPLGLRARQAWGDKFLFAATRAFEPSHGTTELVQAAMATVASNPGVAFAFAGDGRLRAECERRVKRVGMQHAICFLGQLAEEQVAGLFVESDAYAALSRVDGSSISLLQAMACGLPVAVSDIAGNREWVEPDVNGWLMPLDDREAASTALLACAALSPHERSAMGARNRALAVARADWERSLDLLLEACHRLLAGAGTRTIA